MWTRHGASRRGAALRSSARYAAVEFCGAPAEVGAFHTQRSLCLVARTRAVLAWLIALGEPNATSSFRPRMPENKSAAGVTKIGPGTATKNRSLKATLRWLTATEHQNQSCLFVFNRSLSVSDNSITSAGSLPTLPSSWGCMMAALAGARLRLSRAYLAGGTDHDAADAEGDVG